MPSSYRIQAPQGRFITVPSNSSQELIKEKARELLITCDIRNTAKPAFGGDEYSDKAIAIATATRASCSVNLSFSDGVYSARWN